MARPDDHVWKIKNILLSQLVILHAATEQGAKSPLNPILGETLTQKTSSGMVLYMEQTSHHPPISHFSIEGPEDCPFKMYGYIEYTVQIQGAFSSCQVSFPGKMTLDLPDGTQYNMEQAKCEIDGLTSSQKNLNLVGEIELRDMTNMLVARVEFDAQKSRRRTGMMSSFKGSDKKNKDGVYENRKDLLSIEVIQLSEDADSEVVDRADGSYLEKI